MPSLSLPGTPFRFISRWLLFVLLIGPAWAESDYSTPCVFTTLAGAASIGSTDGPAALTRFHGPASVAVDTGGNIYVADALNHTIRKITPPGTVTTIAGAAGRAGSIDGTGNAARFNTPESVAVDAAGNIYVADTGNHTLRKITAAGVVSTLAGAAGQAGVTDGAASAARFKMPKSAVVDPTGNIYVADTGNQTIRKISPAGLVTTLAGTAGQIDLVDGLGPVARFFRPEALAVDVRGDIYIADAGAVRKITPAGQVSTLVSGVSGAGIAVDSGGTIYLSQGSYTIGKVSPTGALSTFAGTAGQSGSADGVGPAARFGKFAWEDYEVGHPPPALLSGSSTAGLSLDSAGNLFVADILNGTIRKITPAAVVSTVAGLGADASRGSVDAAGGDARFGDLAAVAVGFTGDRYVADPGNHTIRKISPTGDVTTLAGTAGQSGNTDGGGDTARFSGPEGVAIDQTGTVYVADTLNYTIRRISPTGIVSTWAGLAGERGTADGTGTAARFYDPKDLTVDATGNVFVADSNVIRKITPRGVVSTVAGSKGSFAQADEPFSLAYYETVEAVAVDATGNLYASYQMNIRTSHAVHYFSTSTIRKFAPDGAVSIRAGLADTIGSDDGPDSQAGFNRLRGLAVDGAGTIYVADSANHLVRRITAAGNVSTVAGWGGSSGSADGLGSDARFESPTGLALAADGTLYVTSGTNVRKGQLAGPPVITTQPQSLAVAAGSSVQFTVAVTGVPAPTYQWLYNGNPFAGATGSTLSFASATTADAGGYTVVVTNALGTATSSRATLTVTAPTPPPPSSGAGGGGGGGAIDLRFVLALLALGATRRRPPAGRPDPKRLGFFASGWRVDRTRLSLVVQASRGPRLARTLPITNLPTLATLLRKTGCWLLLLISGSPLWADSVYPALYAFTTLAGVASAGSVDGIGAAARFYRPQGVAADTAGNLYVADSDNDTIRKITRDGVVTTLAGVAGYPGSTDGPGRLARFDFPSSLVADATGNLYVADANNHAIRKITPAGMVTTLAGAAGIPGSADGNGSAARFHRPEGIALDRAGNLYVADAGNHTIRKVTLAGTVTTLAGSPDASGSFDGAGNAARFSTPFRIAVDDTGTLYVTDSYNWDIRKITPAGVVTTLFYGNILYNHGSRGPLNMPTGIAVMGAGRVFFADANTDTVNEISPTGVVTIVAGSVHLAGDLDGNAGSALFDYPVGLAADATGNLFVAELGNNIIRQISTAGHVTTVAGLGADRSRGSDDGPGGRARFYSPGGAAVDATGNVYLADTYNNTIRKVTRTGVVSTFAGTAGMIGSNDGTGNAARFSSPQDLALDSAGNVYVADSNNNTIRRITPAGVVTTLAGLADVSGNVDGTGGAARFSQPLAIAVDAAANVYVADTRNNAIRKITPAGVVTTLAGGDASTAGTADGTGSVARFYYPEGLAVDATGNVYVADTFNHTIRKITPAGLVSTLVGPGQLLFPRDLAVDSNGQLYLVDSGNRLIRRITPTGDLVTLAGLAGTAAHDDGLGAEAHFEYPRGLALGAAGDLYVTDGNAISVGQPAGPPVVTAHPQNLRVATGSNVAFSAAVTGVPPPTYQWYYNGAPFTGATGSTLTFSNARISDAGDYTLVATNSMGTATSNKATLTVTAAPAPPPPPSSGGGGGGAMEEWFVLALLALGATRRLTARRSP